MAQPSPASSSIPELLSQRLALLRALADSLEEAQAALATTAPGKLDQHSARQRELCRRLCALATGFPDGAKDRTHDGLANDLQETARRVANLNRRYAALLRRRRRTVEIFCRVLASSGTTYPEPKLLSRPDLVGIRPKG
jgi:phage I-like protein